MPDAIGSKATGSTTHRTIQKAAQKNPRHRGRLHRRAQFQRQPGGQPERRLSAGACSPSQQAVEREHEDRGRHQRRHVTQRRRGTLR